jgi:hypothetical protein
MHRGSCLWGPPFLYTVASIGFFVFWLRKRRRASSEPDLVALSELSAKEAATSDKALKIGLVGCLRFRHASSGPHQCVECSSLTRTLRIVPSRHR